MQPNSNDPTPDESPSVPGSIPQQNITSTQRIIQPLSSEEEIRASLIQPPTPIASPIQPITYSNDTDFTNSTAEAQYREGARTESVSNINNSTLITEPLNHSHSHAQPTAHQSPPAVQSPSTQEIPKKKRKVILPIFLLVLIAGLAGAAYIFQGLGTVTVDNLVEEKVQNTSYLRPKQWKSLSTSTSGYGNMMGKDNKSTALVAINVSPTQNRIWGTASEDTLAQLRASTLEQLSDTSVTNAFQSGANACSSKIIVQKEADTSSTPTSIGIYKLTASCDYTTNGEKYIMKIRGIAGRDGYVRTIGLAAVQSSWNKNIQAYDKMIESISQANLQI